MKRPENREEVRKWVKEKCGLVLPEKGVCAEHDSPLDYLCHAFFEQGDCMVWACRGGGKTLMGAVATLMDMVFKPAIQVRILAGSREQGDKMYGYLRGFVEKEFSTMLSGKTRGQGFVFKNGSRVEVLSQSEQSVRGTHVHKLRCDEVEMFTPEVWDAAQLTTMSKRKLKNSPKKMLAVKGSVEGFSTMHLVDGLMSKTVARFKKRGARVFTWCAWDIAEKCEPARDCTTCALWDGCQGKAKRSEGFFPIDDLITMRGRVSDRVWGNEVLCEEPKWDDAVFPGFERARHVRKLDQAAQVGARLVMGVDFGFAGAFAAAWMLVHGKGEKAKVHVIGEFVRSRATLPENILELQLRLGEPLPEVVHVDPAGIAANQHSGKSDIRMMKDAAFRVLYARYPLKAAIGEMERMLCPALGEATLTVDPSCTKLISALENYRWEAARTGRPDKDGVHDHILDALRYGVMGEVAEGFVTEKVSYTG